MGAGESPFCPALREDFLGELERRLRSEIAEFSAGAGHEINNPLTSIAGQARQLLPSETDPARRRSLHKIIEQVDRIHRMIRDLHLVGRRAVGAQQRVSWSSILSEGVAHACRKPRSTRVTIGPCHDTLFAWGNVDDLTRLVSELVSNGMEAAGPSGWVSVQVVATSASTISLRVSDSGPGFTAESRRFALTPFFSGRSAGRGLGMGLPVVQRIAEDHGAELYLGRGSPTVVTVVFPSHQEIRSAA